MKKTLTCIVCPMGCTIEVEKIGDNYITKGNRCKRGEKYAIEELTAPKRVVTSTVKVKNGANQVTSVKTNGSIPKEKIFDVMKTLEKIEIEAPVKIGDIVVENILDTGVNIVVTKECNKA